MREVDRVLHDIDLVGEVGGDVDRRIGDDQRLLVAGNVHHKAVADAARRTDAGVARHNGAHQFVRMQTALHQSLGLSLAHQRDRLCGRVVAVLGGSMAKAEMSSLRRPRRVADAGRRSDQDRLDQAQPGSFHRPLERNPVAGVRDRCLHRLQASARPPAGGRSVGCGRCGFGFMPALMMLPIRPGARVRSLPLRCRTTPRSASSRRPPSSGKMRPEFDDAADQG